MSAGTGFAQPIPFEAQEPVDVGHGIGLHTQDQVAWITLERPTQSNAPEQEMAASLRETCEALDQDLGVRVIVVTGAGDHFCSAPPHPLHPSSNGAAVATQPPRVAATVAALQAPVIAAINGPAIGQGLELALACDLRIAADVARFAMPQVPAGVLPWDGGTQRLTRIVGRGRAMEILMTGREVNAREALDMGLVHEVVSGAELAARVHAVAESIAAAAPIALRYTKEAVLRGVDMDLEAGLRLEADLNILLQSTADRAEGVRSFLERRAPRFRGQ